MKNIYRLLLNNAEYSFDRRKANQLIVKIKKGNSEKVINESKEELFMCLAKIIVKAINNFFNLTKDIADTKILHTREEICSECFIIMSKCVQNSDISSIKKFYFYFNTSLNRGIYRIYQKTYKKHFDVLESSEKTDNLLISKKYSQHIDCSEIDLKGFSEIELEVIKFKISGQKLNIFLKKNKIPASQYYIVFEDVIKKLEELYGDDEHLKNFFNKKI